MDPVAVIGVDDMERDVVLPLIREGRMPVEEISGVMVAQVNAVEQLRGVGNLESSQDYGE